ncbi:restriction endonuclease subunit S [Cytobacillus sp. FSL K6-0265]|uniref:restriction endonuclease subunit S n=1 Tax=Cytobacillus sp. FSL K6-0265 TaxID=2921448 RepID=UPI0030FD164E
MVNKRVPEVRFSGFSGEWEQRKLSEIAEFNPKSILPDEFEYVDLESVVGTNLIAHRTESKESAPSRAQRLAQHGDVFYQTVRPYQKNNYLYDLPYNNYVFSTGYAQMRPIIDSYFLLSRVQEELFVKTVLDRSTGTSYPAINSNDLSEIEIKVPTDNDEQNQIGNFFKQLDERIALGQQELDTLKQTKQGFLQKMFPKEGETVPEVRFPGFSGMWEESIVIDRVEKVLDYRGKSPSKFGMKWGESGYLVLSALNVKDGYIDKQVEAKYGDQLLFERWMGNEKLEKGDVVFTTEAPLGNVAQIPDSNGYILNQRAVGFKVESNKTNSNFLTQLLRSPVFQTKLKANASGGTAKGIGMKEFSKMSALFPTTINEQSKIGEFFNQLDELITINENLLLALKEIKKAFLQKMFI